MTRTRRFEIEIFGNDRSGSRVFRGVAQEADSFGSKVAKVGQTVALGLGLVGVAAVSMGLDFVKAAEESQKVTKQTEAVLASMGNTAGLTAKDVADLSEQLSLKTGIDDELIQSGQNVLLTFGNIRDVVGEGNDVFTRATKAALDMSVAMGTDMQSAVVQVGKALNDPIAGMTALTRVGVQFTDEQKAMIASLVETGDLLGAQKIILAELEHQFGGSAEAQATASDKLKVAWDNLQETLGEKLLPVVNEFSTWLREEGIPWIEDRLIPAVEDLVRWLRVNLVPALRDVAEWLGDNVVPALQDTVNWFGDNEDAVTAVVAAVVALTAVYVALKIAAVASATASAIAWAVALWPIVLAIAIVAALVAAFVLGVELIRRSLNDMGVDFSDTFAFLWQVALATWDGIFTIASGAISGIAAGVSWVGGVIAGVWNLAAQVASAVWGFIVGIVDWAVRQIADKIDWVKDRINDLVNVATNVKFGPFTGAEMGAAAGKVIGKFQSGGIVPGSYAQASLATVHGSEMVLNPPQQANLWALANGAGTMTGSTAGGPVVIFERGAFEGAIIGSQAEADRWVTGAVNRALAKDPRAVTIRGGALATQ